jgi:hypothetical protein
MDSFFTWTGTRGNDCLLSCTATGPSSHGISIGSWIINIQQDFIWSSSVTITCTTTNGSGDSFTNNIGTWSVDVDCASALSTKPWTGTYCLNKVNGDKTKTWSQFFTPDVSKNSFCHAPESCSVSGASSSQAEVESLNLVIKSSSSWASSLTLSCTMIDGTSFSNSIGYWIMKDILKDDSRLSNIESSYNGQTSVTAASSYQNVFLNEDHSNCPVGSCSMTGMLNAAMGLIYPYSITYSKDVLAGYTESYVISCTTSSNAPAGDVLDTTTLTKTWTIDLKARCYYYYQAITSWNGVCR